MKTPPLMLALFLLACGGGDPDADAPARTDDPPAPTPETAEMVADTMAADTAALPDLACEEGLEREIVAAELTREGLRSAFGEPGGVDTTTEPNRHMPDATDSLFDLSFPGLEASIRRAANGAELVHRVEVTDNRFVRHPAIGIGARAERVVEALGEPTSREGDDLVYVCGEAVEQPVTFRVEDGRVSAIEVDFYVD